MADYRGHLAAGAISYGVLAVCGAVVAPLVFVQAETLLAKHWWEIPAQFVIALMAALWPDVDVASRSRILFYRLFLALQLFLIATSRWQAAAFLGLVAILPGIGRHRGWTHRLWAALIVPAPILVVPMLIHPEGGIRPDLQLDRLHVGIPYYLAALTGYLSHLAADGLLGTSLKRMAAVILWPVRFVWPTSDNDHDRRR